MQGFLQIRGKPFLLTELENLKTAGPNGLERKKIRKKNSYSHFICEYVVKITVKIDSSSIERVEVFKYLGTTLTNQNSFQEEIKSRLKVGNACYHSVQNLLSSSLLSKSLLIKIYRTIILPVVLYGCETWSLILREEHRLRVSENRM